MIKIIISPLETPEGLLMERDVEVLVEVVTPVKVLPPLNDICAWDIFPKSKFATRNTAAKNTGLRKVVLIIYIVVK
jgi:hypothetical protein